MKFLLTQLKQHPLSLEIYGQTSDEDIKDLLASMDLEGQKEPIIINQSFEIISGNRRFETAKKLGWTEIEAVQQDFEQSEEEIEIISRNVKRERKPSQMANEILRLKKIYSSGQGSRTDMKVKSSKFHKNIYEDKTCRAFLADLLNISEGTIVNLLYIKKMKPDLFELIDKKKLSIGGVADSLRERENWAVKQSHNTSDFFRKSNTFVDIQFGNQQKLKYSDRIVDEFLEKYQSAKNANKPFFLDDILSQVVLDNEKFIDKRIAEEDKKYLGVIDSFYRAVKSGHFTPHIVTVDFHDGHSLHGKKVIELDDFLRENKVKSLEELSLESLLNVVMLSIRYLHYELKSDLKSYGKKDMHVIVVPKGYREADFPDISLQLFESYLKVYSNTLTFIDKKANEDERKQASTNLRDLYQKIRWYVRENHGFFEVRISNSSNNKELLTNLSEVVESKMSMN